MPIRILHVVTYMGRGGLETMLMNYYRNIDKSKVQFDFLVHRDFEADYDAEILAMGGRIYRLPRLNPFSKNYLSKLDAFFAEHKEYEIVHSHLDCMAGIPLKYAKKHGIPTRIAHAHSSNQTKDKKYILKLFFKKNIKKYANRLYGCSNAAGKWMFETDNFDVLNNAIDTPQYVFDKNKRKVVRNELNVLQDSVVVGHVGRFSAPKNHSFIIDVFNEFQKKEEKAVLLLVGDGELKSEIEKKASELNISDKIIFTGVRTDVNDLLQAMDVFLFPSIYEGLPVSIVEAQASGLPCIISDKVPIQCKITEDVYQLSLNDSIDRWVSQTEICAKLPRENKYNDICQAGFDIKESAEALEKTYLNLVQKKEITV